MDDQDEEGWLLGLGGPIGLNVVARPEIEVVQPAATTAFPLCFNVSPYVFLNIYIIIHVTMSVLMYDDVFHAFMIYLCC